MWVNALQGSEVRIHMDEKYFFFKELISVYQNISNKILIEFLAILRCKNISYSLKSCKTTSSNNYHLL